MFDATPTEYRAQFPPAAARAVVPSCVVRAYGRPQHRTFREDKRTAAANSLLSMKIATTQIWVHDQDEALAFYTEKLGFEVRADVTMPEMGNFRWLTVAPPAAGETSRSS